MAKKLKSATVAIVSRLRPLPRRGLEMLRLTALVVKQRTVSRMAFWARHMLLLWDAAGLAVKLQPRAPAGAL